jgi:hypothetical protein
MANSSVKIQWAGKRGIKCGVVPGRQTFRHVGIGFSDEDSRIPALSNVHSSQP